MYASPLTLSFPSLALPVHRAALSCRPAGTYYWLNRVVVPKVPKRESKKKKKAKMSVGESFAFLAGSRWVASGGTQEDAPGCGRVPTRGSAACCLSRSTSSAPAHIHALLLTGLLAGVLRSLFPPYSHTHTQVHP